ncbi:MAG: hypothetical protein M1826_002775 [Phylliscum demangeonii]|nr:MAG: hypothetical protein M1826_002775 [Phylliscum demangeonii]
MAPSKRKAKAPKAEAPEAKDPKDQGSSVRSIIDEVYHRYLIDWEDDPETGRSYEPTWVAKKDTDAAAVKEWKAEKLEQAKKAKQAEEVAKEAAEAQKAEKAEKVKKAAAAEEAAKKTTEAKNAKKAEKAKKAKEAESERVETAAQTEAPKAMGSVADKLHKMSSHHDQVRERQAREALSEVVEARLASVGVGASRAEPASAAPSAAQPSTQGSQARWTIRAGLLKAGTLGVAAGIHGPILGVMEHVVPLRASDRARESYAQAILKCKDDVEAFVATEKPRTSRKDRMAQLIETATALAIHGDIGDAKAREERLLLPFQQQVEWAAACSAKLDYVGRFLDSVRDRIYHVAILSKPGPLQGIIEDFLKAHRFQYRRLEENRRSEGALGRMMITLMTTGANGATYIVSPADVVIVMDNSFDATEFHVTSFRRHAKWAARIAPVLRPVVANSVEHVDLCIPSTIKRTLRQQMLVMAMAMARNSFGILPDSYPSVAEAAKTLAKYMGIDNKMNAPWPLPALWEVISMRSILELDGPTPSNASSEPKGQSPQAPSGSAPPASQGTKGGTGNKRGRDPDDTAGKEGAKRARLTPIRKSVSESIPRHPQIQTPVGASGAAKVQSLNGKRRSVPAAGQEAEGGKAKETRKGSDNMAGHDQTGVAFLTATPEPIPDLIPRNSGASQVVSGVPKGQSSKATSGAVPTASQGAEGGNGKKHGNTWFPASLGPLDLNLHRLLGSLVPPLRKLPRFRLDPKPVLLRSAAEYLALPCPAAGSLFAGSLAILPPMLLRLVAPALVTVSLTLLRPAALALVEMTPQEAELVARAAEQAQANCQQWPQFEVIKEMAHDTLRLQDIIKAQSTRSSQLSDNYQQLVREALRTDHDSAVKVGEALQMGLKAGAGHSRIREENEKLKKELETVRMQLSQPQPDYRAENEELKRELEIARMQLSQSQPAGPAEVAQLQQELHDALLQLTESQPKLLRAETQAAEAQAHARQMEERLTSMARDFEFTRRQYQAASTAAASLSIEVQTAVEELAALDRNYKLAMEASDILQRTPVQTQAEHASDWTRLHATISDRESILEDLEVHRKAASKPQSGPGLSPSSRPRREPDDAGDEEMPLDNLDPIENKGGDGLLEEVLRSRHEPDDPEDEQLPLAE